jgi:hypothetical protein
MKTHDLAKALMELASILRLGPNVELSEYKLRYKTDRPQTTNVAVGLSTLLALSRIDKKQWQSIIQEYKLEVDVKPIDSTRDLLGKIMRYLENNPDAALRLKQRAAHEGKTSPQLMKALNLLLEG